MRARRVGLKAETLLEVVEGFLAFLLEFIFSFVESFVLLFLKIVLEAVHFGFFGFQDFAGVALGF